MTYEEQIKQRDEACAAGGYCGQVIRNAPPGQTKEEHIEDMKTQASQANQLQASQKEAATMQTPIATPVQMTSLNDISTNTMIIIAIVIAYHLIILLLGAGILSGVNKTNKLLKKQLDLKATQTSHEPSLGQ